MGFQITLFLTLAIYTTQFQEELPVWKNIGETPLLANTVIVCIVSTYSIKQVAVGFLIWLTTCKFQMLRAISCKSSHLLI